MPYSVHLNLLQCIIITAKHMYISDCTMCTTYIVSHDIQCLQQCGVYNNYSEATGREIPGQILRHGSEYQIASIHTALPSCTSTCTCTCTCTSTCTSSSTSSSTCSSSTSSSSFKSFETQVGISNCLDPHHTTFLYLYLYLYLCLHCTSSSATLFVFTFYRTPLHFDENYNGCTTLQSLSLQSMNHVI